MSTQRSPHLRFALLVTLLLAGGLTLMLVLNTASAANELQRHKLASKDAAVAARVQQLRNEVAASAAPGNLAQAAAELGMVPAGHPAFLVIGADGRVRVMGHPRAVSGHALAHQVVPKPHKSEEKKDKKKDKTKKDDKKDKKKDKKNEDKKDESASTSPGTSADTSADRSTDEGTNARTSDSADKPGHGTSSRSTHPSPTSTPTPTITLPGGPR